LNNRHVNDKDQKTVGLFTLYATVYRPHIHCGAGSQMLTQDMSHFWDFSDFPWPWSLTFWPVGYSFPEEPSAQFWFLNAVSSSRQGAYRAT